MGMSMTPRHKQSAEFERLAPKRRRTLAGEFWLFLKHNKKWWLLPIFIVLLLLTLLILFGGTAAPFLYPLF
jgi:Family of unknown function (DUF5989)